MSAKQKGVGHKLNVGDWFESISNRMVHGVRASTNESTYRFYRPGTQLYMQHKNRRYLVEVMGCVERRTGWYYGIWTTDAGYPNPVNKRRQWWQFIYAVKVIAN